MPAEIDPQLYLFFLFGFVMFVGALGVVLHPNPINSAVLLILTFFSLAGIYGILNAVFIATMQVLVYAGAIMVLVVFVLMLLSLREETVISVWKKPVKKIALILLVLALLVPIWSTFDNGILRKPESGFQPSQKYEYNIQGKQSVTVEGNTATVGAAMFLDYLLPFELISILLLSSVLGAVILGKKTLSKKEGGVN